MTAGHSFEEIRVVLAEVADQIGRAQQHAAVARARIVDATVVLTKLGEEQSGLPPAALGKAAEELDRGLGLISGGAEAVAGIDGRL